MRLRALSFQSVPYKVSMSFEEYVNLVVSMANSGEKLQRIIYARLWRHLFEAHVCFRA